MLRRLNNKQTIHERDHPFVESAIFADLIKTDGGQFQRQWHFNDIPGNQSTYYTQPVSDQLHIRTKVLTRFQEQGVSTSVRTTKLPDLEARRLSSQRQVPDQVESYNKQSKHKHVKTEPELTVTTALE